MCLTHLPATPIPCLGSLKQSLQGHKITWSCTANGSMLSKRTNCLLQQNFRTRQTQGAQWCPESCALSVYHQESATAPHLQTTPPGLGSEPLTSQQSLGKGWPNKPTQTYVALSGEAS